MQIPLRSRTASRMPSARRARERAVQGAQAGASGMSDGARSIAHGARNAAGGARGVMDGARGVAAEVPDKLRPGSTRRGLRGRWRQRRTLPFRRARGRVRTPLIVVSAVSMVAAVGLAIWMANRRRGQPREVAQTDEVDLTDERRESGQDGSGSQRSRPGTLVAGEA